MVGDYQNLNIGVFNMKMAQRVVSYMNSFATCEDCGKEVYVDKHSTHLQVGYEFYCSEECLLETYSWEEYQQKNEDIWGDSQ